MRASVHLGRSLPVLRRAEDSTGYLPVGDQDSTVVFPRKPRTYYTPFGWEKELPPKPPPPFEAAPEPDKPLPDIELQPEPQPQPQPQPEPRPQPGPAALPASPTEAKRVAPRVHTYHPQPMPDSAHLISERHAEDSSSLFPARDAEDPAPPRRLGRSAYDALETHGHFGLVDGGETLAGGVRRLVVHVPKRNRGYALDVKPGEVIYANSARGTQARGRLDVLFVSRHKYVSPGHAVTSCVIGVAEQQWRRFMS